MGVVSGCGGGSGGCGWMIHVTIATESALYCQYCIHHVLISYSEVTGR